MAAQAVAQPEKVATDGHRPAEEPNLVGGRGETGVDGGRQADGEDDVAPRGAPSDAAFRGFTCGRIRAVANFGEATTWSTRCPR